MEYWINEIDKANDFNKITEIVEYGAAFDENISNEEYYVIFEYALDKTRKMKLA